MKKICFLTSVHSTPLSSKLFYKDALTLFQSGYSVSIVCQHSKNETIDGIKIVSLEKPKNRFERMTAAALNVFIKSFKADADIYTIYDPEILWIGMLLKAFGKKVVYSPLEAFDKKIFSKKWIPKLLQSFVAKTVSLVEKIFSKFFDGVIVTDSFSSQNFNHCKNLTIIPNYPPISMLKELNKKRNFSRKFVLVYVGIITAERGFFKMLEAISMLPKEEFELQLFGNIESKNFLKEIGKFENVKYFGFIEWKKLFLRLSEADVGLVLLQPTKAYSYCGENTTKLFEYMLCGLPVISSNFTNLKRIVEGNNCGICVDPTNARETADAILHLYENPKIAKKLGENGKKAVLEKYNWETASKELIRVYELVAEKP